MSGGVNIFKQSVEFRDNRLVVIVAGEASGDLHGSNLVKAIREIAPDVSFVGIGGPRLEAAGVKTIVPSKDTAVVGLSEVLGKAGKIVRAYFGLKKILRKQRPSLLILIDYPEFNLRLAAQAKKHGIPVLYYISPQVWAWRSGRVRKIAARVDRMVCILPFEQDFYREMGVQVDYVGHPLLDAIPGKIDTIKVRKALGLEGHSPIIGILPGSREQEIKGLLPAMIKAAEILSERFPSLGCVLPLAPTADTAWIKSATDGAKIDIRVSQGNIYELLAICDCAMVASGTATLEAAIMGVPMVVAYKVSPLSFFVAKRVVKVRHICLVNLVAGYEVVPELIQEDVFPKNLADHVLDLIEDREHRENMIQGLYRVRDRLGSGGASRRAAQIAMGMMERSQVSISHED